jgi:PAS domain S-box-containing protein
LPVPAWLADDDGGIIFVSAAWKGLTGLAGAPGPDAFANLWHATERERVAAAWDAARAAGLPWRDEARMRVWDGSYRRMLTQARPVNGDAPPGAWIATVTDVEATYAEAERAIARVEERYRLVTEALPGTTYTATPDGRIDQIIVGRSSTPRLPDDVRLGWRWLDTVAPEERDDVERRWKAAIALGRPFQLPMPIRMLDGHYRWVVSIARPQRDERGRIFRWIGISIDIDEQRRAGEAREQLARLVEASDDFIAIADVDGKATYVNAAGRDLLGMDLLAGERPRHLAATLAPEGRDVLREAMVPALARTGRWSGELVHRNERTGERIPMFSNVFMLTDSRGRATGVATVSRDLRERYRIDAGLRALAEAGAAMYGSLDVASTVHNVAEAVARSFASYCIVDVVDENGAVRSFVAARPDREAAELLQRAAEMRNGHPEHPATRALRAGESTLVGSLPAEWAGRFGYELGADDVARLAPKSMIYVPIRSAVDGTPFGALTCVIDERDPRAAYTPEDLRFAEEIAVRAGLALDHAHAYQRERRIAVRLQEASLPRALPVFPGLRLTAEYRPGKNEATIGGDWYDAFVLADGRMVITIGDVLGNGLAAAVTMGKVRQAMQSVALVFPDPATMLAAADHIVCDTAPETYATALAGIYDATRGEFRFACAGHPGPVVRGEDGSIEAHHGSGVMLGLRNEIAETPETCTVAAPPGSLFVFHTDGLVETTHDYAEGHRRLHAAMADRTVTGADNPAHALVEYVLGGGVANDDIAVLVAEIAPRT